jgi:putative flippase GtrA
MIAEFLERTERYGLSRFWGLVEQILKFTSVGVLNTLIDATTYYLLTRFLPLFAIQPVMAKGTSYVVGMINSFFWNRSWTFKSKASMGRSATLFTLTHVAALGINAGVMAFSLDILHFPEVLSFTLATGASFIWNFSLNKWVVFRSPLTQQFQTTP